MAVDGYHFIDYFAASKSKNTDNPYWGVDLIRTYKILAVSILIGVDGFISFFIFFFFNHFQSKKINYFNYLYAEKASRETGQNLSIFARTTYPDYIIKPVNLTNDPNNALCSHFQSQIGFLPGETKYLLCKDEKIGQFLFIMQMDYGKTLQLTEVEVYGDINKSYCKIY